MAATTKATKKEVVAKTTKTDVASAPAKVAAPVKKAPVTHTPTTNIVTAEQLRASDDVKMAGIRFHGKEFVGTVISDKAHKTVSVEWERRRLITKYERYEKRYSRVYAHNPPMINARMGDVVRIVETRPLSKTKNFVVVEIVKRAGAIEVQAVLAKKEAAVKKEVAQ